MRYDSVQEPQVSAVWQNERCYNEMKQHVGEKITHIMKIVAKKIKDAIKAFTLIELLISIGIVAALSTVTFIALNPVEIFKQTRDASRLASLDALKKSITIMQTQKGFTNLGVANVLYVSLPDPTPSLPVIAPNECPGVSANLPLLPTPWKYHCVAPENLAKSNGTGWIPTDLTDAGLSILPLDPLNKLDTADPLQGHFYVYATDGLGHFEVNAKMESIKYGLEGQ